MPSSLAAWFLAFCGYIASPGPVLGTFEGQLNRPEFPVIPDCQQGRTNLILISDASSVDYATHLQLLCSIVDTFASGQENSENLKVSMAVSASDEQDKPQISWHFKFGAYSKTSAIKEAIMSDIERNRSSTSFLKEAVHFVYDFVHNDTCESRLNEHVSTTPVSPSSENVQGGEVNTTNTQCDLTNDLLDTFKNSSLSGANSGHDAVRPTTLVVILANPKLLSHTENDPKPEKFSSEMKLLIVYIYPRDNFRRNVLCIQYSQNPCISLLAESMLADHSLSLALCDRCLPQWFGPMPSASMLVNYSHTVNIPVHSHVSCYNLVYTEYPENYALKATEKCTAIGASLVSIETMMELKVLEAGIAEQSLLNREYPENITSVFIGLQRNSKSLGKRFRWINERPLIYSNWLDGYPLGGYTHGCAVWHLRLGGWIDIGCGYWMKNSAALCEWTKLKTQEGPGISYPARPSEANIQRALIRGQVAICEFYQTEMMLLPSHYTYGSHSCSWLTNNTGMLQILNTPISEKLLFPCENDYGFVLFSNMCNQEIDCFNNKDESSELCDAHGHHNYGVFTCTTSDKEVPVESRCDLFKDCVDGSDEEKCQSCQFGLCSDGRCVPQTWLTDGQKDCLTMDSHIKPDVDNSINADMDCAFLCNRSDCVPWSKLGDGVVDCLGPEGPLDETLGAMKTANCSNVLFTEWAPKCIYQKDRLGELIGCRNMRHLHGCEDFMCPEGYVKCPGAYCIPVHYLYNDEIDCPMAEDEPIAINTPNFLSGYFKCKIDVPVFIHPDRICDGSEDCSGGTDEMGCHVTCAEGFLCIAGFVVSDNYDKAEPLTNISFIDAGSRMIDLSHINISSALLNICDLNLFYLLDLRLSNCSLSELFVPRRCLPRLSKLDMTYNLFVNISEEIFVDMPPIYYGATTLRSFNLSHNVLLEVFDTRTLVTNFNLLVLDLSYTALTKFIDMDSTILSLTHLNLSHTRITRLSSLTFPNGFKPIKLETLDLRGITFVEVEPDAFKGLVILSDIFSDYFKVCCPQLRGDGIPAHTCHAPSDPLSSCFNLIENKLLRVLVWVMGVTSLVGNTSVIIARLISGRTTLRMPYAQLVTQLGVSDLLMGVYLIIIAFKNVKLDGEYALHENTWRHSRLCKAAGFLSTLSSEVSSVLILLITVDRFLVIKYPFGQHRLTQCGVVTSSIIAWSLGLILAAVPLLPWTKHWEVYSSNAVCLGLPLLPERRAGWQFSTIVFIAFNCLLCLVIAVGQLAIYKAASETRDKAPRSGTLGPDEGLSPRMKQDLLLARRLAAVAFTDLLCWVPIGVLGFLALDGHELGGEAYAWMAIFVMPVNSALNPVLYSLPVVRGHLVKLFAKCIISKKTKKFCSVNNTRTTGI
ncbi:relaxin receptor-like protein [Elysia marginata]|uniref:Relaxin receptor-like protein n=1 Tax=Elysia marginata TaxID=1093978 RepID=A0AAV4J7Z1_9GAST|nr:relaxin receptor-like protein [Elysia marginata]